MEIIVPALNAAALISVGCSRSRACSFTSCFMLQVPRARERPVGSACLPGPRGARACDAGAELVETEA